MYVFLTENPAHTGKAGVYDHLRGGSPSPSPLYGSGNLSSLRPLGSLSANPPNESADEWEDMLPLPRSGFTHISIAINFISGFCNKRL